MKRNKFNLLFFFLLVFATSIYGLNIIQEYNNPLTRSQANNFFCQLGIGCDDVANESTLIYGEMLSHNDTGTTVDIPQQGVYVNVTGFNVGDLNGVLFKEDSLNVTQAGVYRLNYQIAFSGGANKEYQLTTFVNNIVKEDCETHRTLGTGGDVGSASGTCLLAFNRSDIIRLAVKLETPGPPVDIVHHGINLNIMKMGVPVAGSNGTDLDTLYLRLDTSNDPLTGVLDVNGNITTTCLSINGSKVCNWLEVNTTPEVDTGEPNRTILIYHNNTDESYGTTGKVTIDKINLSQFNTTNWRGMKATGVFYRLYSGKNEDLIKIVNCTDEVPEFITSDTVSPGLGLDATSHSYTVMHYFPKAEFCDSEEHHFQVTHVAGTEGIVKKYVQYEAII